MSCLCPCPLVPAIVLCYACTRWHCLSLCEIEIYHCLCEIDILDRLCLCLCFRLCPQAWLLDLTAPALLSHSLFRNSRQKNHRPAADSKRQVKTNNMEICACACKHWCTWTHAHICTPKRLQRIFYVHATRATQAARTHCVFQFWIFVSMYVQMYREMLFEIYSTQVRISTCINVHCHSQSLVVTRIGSLSLEKISRWNFWATLKDM